MTRRLHVAALVAVLLVFGPGTAAAQYLDPGVGSLLLQGLIALIAAVVTTGAIYWRRIKGFVDRLRRRGAAGGSGANAKGG